jgi:CDP-paratose 2-epimerase
MKKVLITGSAGLIGGQACRFFYEQGYQVVGVDNDMRSYFFGDAASTGKNLEIIKKDLGDAYEHHSIDLRNQEGMRAVFQNHRFDVIIHTAAQPSHDWAAREPVTDFEVNALSTLYLLENYRNYCPEATFIFTSTNKVYGDLPNQLPLIELDTRYEIDRSHRYAKGIDETMSIDQSTHSVFGASKVAADVMVQEYGRYFGLNTGVFRGGCLTGPSHSGAQLHGFLAYLIKCIEGGIEYTILGYKGKQVRDNIHSLDLVNMFWHFHNNPRGGEVYNVGGGRNSNISIIEAIQLTETILGKRAKTKYIDENRVGDHIWYVSNIAKFQSHYPGWEYKYDIKNIVEEICRAQKD